jgi:hypothetical protein
MRFLKIAAPILAAAAAVTLWLRKRNGSAG